MPRSDHAYPVLSLRFSASDPFILQLANEAVAPLFDNPNLCQVAYPLPFSQCFFESFFIKPPNFLTAEPFYV